MNRLFVLIALTLWPIGTQAQTWGKPDAPTTLMVFSAFTCPHCAEANTLLKTLQSKYPNDLQIVFKNFPLSDAPDARQPHLIAVAAASQGKFWEAHDLLFEKSANAPDLKLLLAAKGLDHEQLAAFIKSGGADKQLERELAEASALNVRATPTFFINGLRLEGLQDIATLDQIIRFRTKSR